jgi:DNA-binding PucR family transcriptional regulator
VGYLGELLTTAEGPELMDTLHAWLDQHGQVDAAAQRLGIHRHTVRHRLRRAEGVLGRPLDDPAVRADLWFALSAARPTDPDTERG